MPPFGWSQGHDKGAEPEWNPAQNNRTRTVTAALWVRNDVVTFMLHSPGLRRLAGMGNALQRVDNLCYQKAA